MAREMTAQLRPKQQRFVEEYCLDFNATKAAERAGYSKKTARQIGTENLAKPAVADAIAERMAQLTEKADVTFDGVMQGLNREANYTGPGASHGARVAAYGHLSKYLDPDRAKVGGEDGGTRLRIEIIDPTRPRQEQS